MTKGIAGRPCSGHLGGMDVDGFLRDGYVMVRGAFDAATAAACLAGVAGRCLRGHPAGRA
jgi:hypothetical protein